MCPFFLSMIQIIVGDRHLVIRFDVGAREEEGSLLRTLLISPGKLFQAGFSTLTLRFAGSAGCRDVFGPVPQPLTMRNNKSTNQDNMFIKFDHVNSFFFVLAEECSTTYQRRVVSDPSRSFAWHRLCFYGLVGLTTCSPRLPTAQDADEAAFHE